jgi:hypothetical protein
MRSPWGEQNLQYAARSSWPLAVCPVFEELDQRGVELLWASAYGQYPS